MYKKKFTVRWSEIDPNMHLTSSAYVKYITDTRMNFFEDQGFGLPQMREQKIGPIVLWEKSYYFKEVLPGEPIEIHMTNAGASEDGRMIRLEQRIYNSKKENCFLAYTLVAFMDVIRRKIVVPEGILFEVLGGMPKSKNYKILTKNDLRDADAQPS